jgi:lipoprotein-releasing system permease protein
VEIASVAWEGLLGVGTTLTLTAIVVIALAINALAFFYVSSAVVVLERFARTVRRARWVLVFGAATALAAAYLALAVGSEQELLPLDPFGGSSSSPSIWGWVFTSLFASTLAATSALTAVAVGVCLLALRRLSSARLGNLVLVLLGGSLSLMLGATGRLEFALAPPLAVLAVLLVLLLRARLRSGRAAAPSGARRSLAWLAAALASGPVLALAISEPAPELAAVGGGMLQLLWVLILMGLLPLAAAGLVEMRRSAEWFLAIRYLVARRRQVYISAITLLCIGGIAAGVWLIVTVLSVMNGFERAWREQIVGDLAHFTVHSGIGRIQEWEPVIELVRQVPDVLAASPYLDAEGMVRSSSGRLFGVRLRGVELASADRVTDVSSRIENGTLAELLGGRDTERTQGAEGEAVRRVPAIVIGAPLAEKLEVAVGAELVLIAPLGGPQTPLGPAPRLKKFRVAGIYQSRLHQFGEVYTYVDLGDAQNFVRAGSAIDGIEARTPDLYTSRRVAEAVRARLDSPYYTRDWKDHFPVFFAALRDNRSMMILLLGMIMVVAAFMIVATLMMMIMEKSSDIAILKAMGAEDATIERVFAIEGALIGLSGTTLGVLAGLAVTARLDWIQSSIEAFTGVDTLPASIYQLSTLPADHDPVQLAGIIAMAMVLSLGATLVPARQGARFDPVEGLRSE